MNTRHLSRSLLFFTFIIMLSGFASVPEDPVPQEPAMGDCDNYDPNKQPYFGDLHVHTALSLDAVQFDARNRPDQAYEFAKGAPVGLPPYDQNGQATRTIQLDQKLDFAGLSDHSEFLAEADICFNRDSIHYYAPYCITMRGSEDGNSILDTLAFILAVGPAALEGGTIDPSVCTLRPWECAERTENVWQEIQDAAEDHYDRSSSCDFTTFVGYEWTGTPGFANQHRNVFFKDENVPDLPVSYFDADLPRELWSALDQECTNTGTGCEVLTIPHNSNLGGGELFNPYTENGNPYTASLANTRARMEPLVEIYQHKGASECLGSSAPYGSNDEFCDFELVVSDVCKNDGTDSEDCVPLCTDYDLLLGGGMTGACVEPSDFVRGALRQGLEEQRRIGANPFQFGFIGSTDTHNATPGATEEYKWDGHVGTNDDTLEERVGVAAAVDNGIVAKMAELIPGIEALTGIASLGYYSPGGLAVVWAKQNSRHAIFESMQKRETYATSGTRIVLRTFTGDDIPDDICSDPDFAETGYQSGAPMGGELPFNTSAPKIAVSAMMHNGPNPTPLQRVQVIKGWEENGVSHEAVINVAGDLNDYGDDPGVDLESCESTRPTGFASICTVWQDQNFDPDQNAFYYTRVLENPTCRWNRLQCNEALSTRGITDSSQLDNDDPLQACFDGSLPDTIQERAWSSPVWYKS